MKNSLTKWAIILGVVLVGNMLFNYSLSLIYSEPSFEELCPDEDLILENKDPDSCKKTGGAWVVQFVEDLGTELGYCNIYGRCNAEFEENRAEYERMVFFTLVGAGIIILILALIIKIPTISIAFSITAFVDLMFASIRYWEYSDELMRVAILFVALLVLIFIAITRYIHKKQNGEIQSQGNRDKVAEKVGDTKDL